MEVNSKTKDLEVIKSTENSWNGNKVASFQGQYLFFIMSDCKLRWKKLTPGIKNIQSLPHWFPEQNHLVFKFRFDFFPLLVAIQRDIAQ